MHITNDLLEIGARHRNNTRKLDRRNGDRPDIQLNQIECELGHHLLLAVHDLDTQLRGVRLSHEQNDALVVAHRLHELEEVDHVDAEDVLLEAVELVESICLQPQMHQDRVCSVHRHDLEARAVKLEIGVRQNIFDRLNKCTKGGGLDGADAEEHVVSGRVHSTPGTVFAFKL